MTNPDIHEALVELSKLDGAFVVRGDGFIQKAGAFLASAKVQIDLPAGQGTRPVAAAAVTRRTAATAVVVSATDGNVRIFSDGKMVLQIDPNVAHGPVALDEKVVSHDRSCLLAHISCGEFITSSLFSLEKDTPPITSAAAHRCNLGRDSSGAGLTRRVGRLQKNR